MKRICSTTSFLITCWVFSFAALPDPGWGQTQADAEPPAPAVGADATDKELYARAAALRTGTGPATDLARAVAIYDELAGRGHLGAMNQLARLYETGTGVERDYARAAELYRAAAAAGKASALLRLASVLEKSGKGEEALAQWEKAAAAGIRAAPLRIARGHSRGLFGTASDPGLGLSLLEKLADAGEDDAAYALADAYRLGRGTAADPARSFEIYKALGDKGNPAALHRLGLLLADGIGVERDAGRATEVLASAVELGREDALLDLARLQVETGQGEAALATLTEAETAGVEGASLELAVGHLRSSFGAASDPAASGPRLTALAKTGMPRAAALLLGEIAKGNEIETDLDAVIAAAADGAKAGDRRAAEALVRFYRSRPDLTSCAAEKHANALVAYGSAMRPKQRMSEVLRSMYDPKDLNGSWRAMSELLATTGGEDYYHGLRVLNSIDKRAYTYALQVELRDRGLFNGRADGRLTKNTIRALLRLCRSEGIGKTCSQGPLRSEAVERVARALSKDRPVAPIDLESYIRVPVCTAAAPRKRARVKLAKGVDNLVKPWIQVGLFCAPQNAAKAVRTLGSRNLTTRIRAAKVDGKNCQRVLTGPARSSAERLRIWRLVRAQGNSDAYYVKG